MTPKVIDPQHTCPWKEAIIDACIVDWVFTKAHETDPRAAINDLLMQAQKMALDPTISMAAAQLHEKIARLEQERDQAQKAFVEQTDRLVLLEKTMEQVLEP